MSSIMTNTSALTALQSLNATNANLNTTQSRISTGYKVASASDNAAYWSIATTMRSDNSALSTVKDALGLGSSTIDVAYTGVNSAIDVTKEIKNKLVAALQPGVDREKIQSEITELQSQLKSIGDSSSFSGQNWISTDSSATGYNATKSIVASFNRSGGAVSVATITFDTSGSTLFDASTTADGILDGKRDATGALSATGTASVATMDISALTDSTTDLATLNGYVKAADAAISEMTTSASNLGAVKSRVTLQKDFVTNLMSAITTGVGTLVDADMNEESTRLQALQVQQQLGVQALSIANQSSQTILSLFR
ncbi:flagellin [Aestuariivirga sp.]|uniref:flagellin N-terminal helical domain-containing protein n=1 Tax=Aestuariivirga sp. TaxID=2650926 RepID=UPI0039E3108F